MPLSQLSTLKRVDFTVNYSKKKVKRQQCETVFTDVIIWADIKRGLREWFLNCTENEESPGPFANRLDFPSASIREPAGPGLELGICSFNKRSRLYRCRCSNDYTLRVSQHYPGKSWHKRPSTFSSERISFLSKAQHSLAVQGRIQDVTKTETAETRNRGFITGGSGHSKHDKISAAVDGLLQASNSQRAREFR